MAVRGTFEPEIPDKPPKTWRYKIVSWIDGRGTQRKGYGYEAKWFIRTDTCVAEVTSPKGKKEFVTLYGPFVRQDEISDTLAQDYGVDGSRYEFRTRRKRS